MTTEPSFKQSLTSVRMVPQVLRLVWDAHPGLTVLLAGLNVLQGLQPVAQAWLNKLVIDTIAAAAAGRSLHDPYVLIALAAGLTLASTALEPTSTFAQVQLGDHLKRRIQERILVKANALADVSYFENPDYYDRLQRAQNDANYRPLNVMAGVVQIFRSVVHLVGVASVLLAFQPLLLVFALLLTVPSIIQQFQSQLRMYAINWHSVPEVRRMRYFTELITGKESAKEVRLFGLGTYLAQRFQHEFDTFHARFRVLRFRHCRWESGAAVISALGASAVYAYLVLQTLAQRISLGDLSLLSQAGWQTHGRVTDLVRQVSSLYSEILFVNDLFAFLETPPAMAVPAPGEGRRTPLPLREGIEFRDVTFRYPGTDRAILEGLSLQVRPGECVALVGENGAGKTTIVKLLTRLYDPDEGQVLVDGEDLKEHDLDDWRRQSAAIFQDFTHYHLSARENIGLGDLPHMGDQAAVETAAARGGATSVVAKLAGGYDAILGRWLFATNNKTVEEGSELSGGEWQKVALSRGFMRSDDGRGAASVPDGHDQPGNGRDLQGPGGNGAGSERGADPLSLAGYAGAQLLILDEPTAALDTQSEYDVYLRFHELTRGKATLLISHRFSTVRMADRIIVLENGRIIEQGTHAELMALNGTYADLYEKQASRYR